MTNGFTEELVDMETFAQAALGLLIKKMLRLKTLLFVPAHMATYRICRELRRQFTSGTASSDPESRLVTVTVNQTGQNIFTVVIEGPGIEKSLENVICNIRMSSITTFFPHTRIETTMVADGNKLTLFQHGKQMQVTVVAPIWYEKALGIKEVTNSVSHQCHVRCCGTR